jgi:ribonuclease VapC
LILDSSAVLAILLDEPEADRLLRALETAGEIGIGAPTLVETSIVLSARLGASAAGLLDTFLATLEVKVLSFGEPHWREAAAAFRRFGRGRHPAALNFGDCLAYAVARLENRPLLHTGEDFSKTDLAAG